MYTSKTAGWLAPVAIAGLLAIALALLSRTNGWQLLAGCAAFATGFLAVLYLTGNGFGTRTRSARQPLILSPTTAQQVGKQPATQPPVISEQATDAAVQRQFDALPIALLRIGGDGTVIQSNKAARDFLGIDAEERPAFDDLVEGLGRSVASWLAVAREKSSKSKPEMVQVKRGSKESVLQVSLMDSPGGSAGTLIATLSDATELKSLEAQFVQSQKMQAIGQLAGGVAHDFNNLLTAISGYCDLLLLRHDRGDQGFGDLLQISQNANRAAALVGQLLAFSRKQTLQPQVLEVNDTLSDLTHLLSRLLGEKV